MQALKALVIIMGVLIILGTTVVVVTIYNRLSGDGGEAARPQAAATGEAVPRAAAAAAFLGEKQIAIPEACRVVEMVPAGDRLLLRLGSRPRCDRILVVDLTTGSQLGTLDIVTQP